MKSLSCCLDELNAYLVGILQPIDRRLQAELALRPLDAAQVQKYSQKSLCLVTSLQRTTYNREQQRLWLAMSSVLPYRLDAGDKSGRTAMDLMPAITKGLESYGADWLCDEVCDIACSNLSFRDAPVALWGISYGLKISIGKIASEGAELGKLLDSAALGDLEEAGGKSPEHKIEGETRWD